jgi:hypothetical protein
LEGFVIEVFRQNYLTVSAKKALIFVQGDHNDPRLTVPLDTHRTKHCLIGIVAELARYLLGRDLQKWMGHGYVLSFFSGFRVSAVSEFQRFQSFRVSAVSEFHDYGQKPHSPAFHDSQAIMVLR